VTGDAPNVRIIIMQINNFVIDLIVMRKNLEARTIPIEIIEQKRIIEEKIGVMRLILNQEIGYVQNVRIIIMQVKISVIDRVAM
jgi:hypothetical protein